MPIYDSSVTTRRKTWAFAAVFALLGTLFHVLAHGAVAPWGLGILGVLSVALAVPAARITITPRSLPVVFLALFAGQLVLHVVLAGVGHGGSTTTSVVPTGHMASSHALAALLAAGVLYFADTLAAAWSRFLASVIGSNHLAPTPIPARAGAVFAETVLVSYQCDSGHVWSRGPPLASATR